MSEMDFDMQAAWLRRFNADAESNLKAFALRLKEAMPDLVTVHEQRGLFAHGLSFVGQVGAHPSTVGALEQWMPAGACARAARRADPREDDGRQDEDRANLSIRRLRFFCHRLRAKHGPSGWGTALLAICCPRAVRHSKEPPLGRARHGLRQLTGIPSRPRRRRPGDRMRRREFIMIFGAATPRGRSQRALSR
jgi:hypothetical protein